MGGPINTANGNYHYEQRTPAIPTVGEPLQFIWSYNSLQSGAFPDMKAITTTLGVGWTHNYDLRLTGFDIGGSSGQPDTGGAPVLTFKAFHGTPLKFEYVKGAYRPAPGVHGALTRTATLGGGYVYTLTAASQATYIFNTDGRLLAEIDPQGNRTTFAYNADGTLAQVLDPVSGRYLNLAYNGTGRLVTVSDPAGRSTHFGYDGQGRLTTVTDTRGKVWQYDYALLSGGQSVLQRVTDPDGRVVEQTGFDDLGRAITQTYRGENLSIGYYNDGRRIITDGAGRRTVHLYDTQNILVSTFDAFTKTDIFVADAYGNRVYEVDKNGNPTRYSRTPMGYTTAISDALGNVTRYEYDERHNMTRAIDALGNETLYLYDGQNNLISTTNALGYTTLNAYNARGQVTATTDARGNVTRYGYNAWGQRTVITDALGNVTRFEYDAAGRLLETIDPAGKITRNEYDGGDNLIRVTENYLAGQPQNYLNEYNLVTEYGYDGAGRQILITDTLGHVNRNEYDSAGRLWRSIQNVHPTVSTQNYLNEYNLITEYVYDTAGNLVETIDTLGRVSRTEYNALNRTERTIVNYVDGIFDPAKPDEDIITRYEYDANGNLTGTFDVFGRETRTEYDALNRTARTIVNYVDGVFDPAKPDEDLITAYTYDENGNQKTVTDPLGHVTTYTYDALNRVVTVTDPAGNTTAYGYDPAGNRITVTDPLGRVTITTYDSLGRAVATTDALGGQTTTVYDSAGRRSASIDANGHTTTFNYDSLGRMIAVTDAASQTTAIGYNALGQRTFVTDAEGHTTTYTYDSLGRVLTVTNALSGTTGVTYNALGNRLGTTDANGHTTTFVYDNLNRVIQTTDPNNLSSATVYNGLGQRVSVTNGAGETTTFEYDNAGRLISTRDPLGNETTYRYNGAGNRVAMIDANGIETRYEYDELGRLMAVIENYEDGIYDPAFTDRDVRTEYTYDRVGNRLTVTDANAHTTTYTYDALNRRTETRNPLGYITRYDYDAVGNRTVLTDANGTVTTFNYDSVNRLTGIDYGDATPDVTFGYNRTGQRTVMVDGTGVTTYTYNSLNQLTGVNDGAGEQVGYTYDAAGNRSGLIYPDGKVITYTYDAGNRLAAVTDWRGGQYTYTYDGANRMTHLTLPNGVGSGYAYDSAGRLRQLSHQSPMTASPIATYEYAVDGVGNRRILTETLLVPNGAPPAGTYLEENGAVVMEAENGEITGSGQLTMTRWVTLTAQSGYTGTAYLQSLPDVDTLYHTGEITAAPALRYRIAFSAPGTYTLWLRGMASDAGSDSAYAGLNGQPVTVTGFAPGAWDWSDGVQLPVEQSGVYTLSVWVREDGLRLDRLLLTTDTAYLPSGFGPAESARQTATATATLTTLAHTINYGYDGLYRLTSADYTGGEAYRYAYDPVGNRLQQIINGDTTEYLYDAANRLAAVDGVSYTFDANGNLLATGSMTNTWDAANRLQAGQNVKFKVQNYYNGTGNRVAEVSNGITTTFTLDIQGLPEVIQTGAGETYLHLPGIIVTESAAGEIRYLLGDGLGSVRQAVDELGAVVAYNEYDPYGNPYFLLPAPYAFTGEWWQDNLDLLYLRARWYAPATGTFLSVDPVESEPPYAYVGGNVVNLTDPTGWVTKCNLPNGWKWMCDVEGTIGGFVGEPIGKASLVAAVQFTQWAYSTNGFINCANIKDDGQLPSDTVDDVFVDFVCEYGPNPRHFSDNDQLTKELAQSHIISKLRNDFYNSPPWNEGISGTEKFRVNQFIMATKDSIEVRRWKSVTHFLGGFTYDIKLIGSKIKFHIRNTTGRQSGTRIIPGSGSGGSIEDALSRGETFWAIRDKVIRGEITSILRNQTRNETNNSQGVGGGNYIQIFEWRELFDLCKPQFGILK